MGLPRDLQEVQVGKVNGFTRRILMQPAFDLGGQYGIGGIKLIFFLGGEKGGVDWSLLTNMFLPETHDRHRKGNVRELGPTPGPVNLHSRTPTEDDKEGRDDCLVLDPDRCYDAGGSFTWGERPYEVLARDGLDAMWDWMEATYRAEFDG